MVKCDRVSSRLGILHALRDFTDYKDTWHENISCGMLAKLQHVTESVVISGQCGSATSVYLCATGIVKQSGS